MTTDVLIDPWCGKPAFWATSTGMHHVFRKTEFFCESCRRNLTVEELQQMVVAANYRPKVN